MISPTPPPNIAHQRADYTLKPKDGTAALPLALKAEQDAFQQAMQPPAQKEQTSTPEQKKHHAEPDERQPQSAAQPITMLSLPARVEYAPAASLSPAVQEQLLQQVERLYLAPAAPQAELNLLVRQELLPGVSIRLQEIEGRVLVCFSCAVEPVRRQLDRQVERLAQTLANRLHRDVLVQVQTDDPGDLRLHESLAQPVKV
ncbi:hypothetical protein [Alcaligenes endophyticus]|uniref:Flagellar hook-length control protein FliK n=1 Tax=Alcaligenes endophyticus TaxID=1929088 RepID=A0ABT8EFJ3_9BURK|nr:hypothetical protein [Alcaligenes endophyticus]MCX5590279.1 hypothetical protein [Alcaligenes endophyticus]MDN4120057.1 hypothetical protein [Alcaligenes endophyticus]